MSGRKGLSFVFKVEFVRCQGRSFVVVELGHIYLLVFL